MTPLKGREPEGSQATRSEALAPLMSSPIIHDYAQLSTHLERYKSHDMTTIPLIPGGKRPLKKGWQRLSSEEQWSRVTTTANVGVRAGDGDLLILDCDDLPTGELLWRWLEGLGVNVVGVHTRRGCQFYVRTEVPMDFTKSKMPSDFEGDVLGRRSYGVAVPSVVDGWTYKSIGELGSMPVVEWRDLSWLVPARQVASPDALHDEVLTSEGLPVKLLKRPMSQKVKAQLNWLRSATQGQSMNGYTSRSEVVRAAVLELSILGWSFEDIRQVMPRYKGSKWLWQDFQRATTYIANYGERPALLEALSRPPEFEGRNRSRDLTTWRAVVSYAWQVGSSQLAIPQREVAMLAGCSSRTAWKSLRRLEHAGALVRVSTSREETATCYLLKNGAKVTNIHSSVCVSKRESKQQQSELWSYSCLGTSAGIVWGCLTTVPQRIKDLSNISGLSKWTVSRALRKLEDQGLTSKVTGGWVRGSTPLEEVEAVWSCSQRQETRRKRFERERQTYRRRFKDLTKHDICVKHLRDAPAHALC